MPAELVDLRIDARWILPMSSRGGPLADHSLLVRDGRIAAIAPRADAARRFQATAVVERATHLLMPGLIDAHAHAPLAALRGLLPETPPAAFDSGTAGAPDARVASAQFAADAMPSAIAEMLTAGVTCFADHYWFPGVVARAAAEHGMRAVVAAPVAERASPAGEALADHLHAALALHDEYRGHPSISTAFAPADLGCMSDAALARLKVLADELDTRIALHLHESGAELRESVERHGLRPIERLHRLGLLTPALRAVHMTQVDDGDLRLAAEGGIAATLCASSNLRLGNGLPEPARLAACGIALGLGTDGGAANNDLDLWHEIRLVALAARRSGAAGLGAWDVLALATRGAAAALGLDAEVGTLEDGKWADLCCVDVAGPATPNPGGLLDQLVFCGGRDIVTDVWIAGRQLVAESRPTRLDWSDARARMRRWVELMTSGG